MKIVKKEILAENKGTRVTKIEIEAPLIAKKAKAGQFVVLMADEKGERIPLTIVDADKKNGVITLIFQELGFTTRLLGALNKGEKLYSIVGPLGHATEIKNYGRVILVGGGVGIAEIYPVAKAMKEMANHVTVILGARIKEFLILEKELKAVSDELRIVTDDGSYGEKGFTTDVLKTSLQAISNEKIASSPSGRLSHSLPSVASRNDEYSLVYAVGPIPMMRRVSQITKEFGVKTIVSLNALMVDGTGMCGCCRVSVEGRVKFSCVDGPEFDGHKVNWEELEKRSKIYCRQEDHICKLKTKTA